MSNSFIHELHAVDFSHYVPQDVKQAIDFAVAETMSAIRALMKIPKQKRTFENTVLAYTRSTWRIGQLTSICDHLQTMDNEKWQEAQQLSLNAYTKLALILRYDKKLYTIFKEFKKNTELGNLESRILSQIIDDYEADGIALDIDKQREIRKLSKRHVNLGIQFLNNITTARKNNSPLFKSESELDGLSKEFIKQASTDARSAKKQGYLIKANDGTYDIVMTSCTVAKTRKKMYDCYSVSPAKKNHKVMFELLQIRQRMAQLLGFETPGHMFMRTRMITDAKEAIEFLEKLDTRYIPKAKQEYQEIQSFVSQYESSPVSDIAQYEYDSGLNLYYTCKMFEKKFSVDLDQIKEYFEFNHVRSYMFDTLSKLYSVNFRRLTKKSWHESVEVYSIHDQNGKQLAEVHCDWFARDRKKGHAWMNNFYSSSKSDSYHHIGCVVMNMPAPTETSPCLMTPEHASTMWHEFGHFMHQAFESVTYPELGTGNIKRDFIEAPSQIMENWTLHDEILPNYAVHYKTGKALDRTTIEVVKKMDQFNMGIKLSRQHFLALLDLHLHSIVAFESIPEMAEYVRTFRQKTLMGPVYKEFSTLCTFGHIASGYISGYYTYRWSDCIQADLFSRFKSEGLLNPQVGNDYRSKILSRGDEEDPSVLIRDFLGRDISLSAVYDRDNV